MAICFFPEDIKNALRCQIAMAMRYPPGDFRDGYIASVEDTALAFGVDLPRVRPPTRPPDIIDVGGDYG